MKEYALPSKKYLHSLLQTVTAAGLFLLAGPILAEGILAGTKIASQATGTYDHDMGRTFSVTSNSITVEIGEVAGITVEPTGMTDVNGGSIQNNDILLYDFLVTNTGNNQTRIFIPSKDQLVAIGSTIEKVEIVQFNGTNLSDSSDEIRIPGEIVKIPDTGGYITDSQLVWLVPGRKPAGAIEPNESLTVRVTTTSTRSYRCMAIPFRFGNTADNNNTKSTQNQPDVGTDDDTGGELDDVRTVDIPDGADGEYHGEPLNGEREASAWLQINYSCEVAGMAFMTVKKSFARIDTKHSRGGIDLGIVYRLDLRVENTPPNGYGYSSTLAGTTINLDGLPEKRILISDAIPAGVELDLNVIKKELPGNVEDWTLVYTTDEADNRKADYKSALHAAWQTYDPLFAPTASSIKRIGFVYKQDGTLEPGYTTETHNQGLILPVIGRNLIEGTNLVANIAQAFGQTEEDFDNTILYDESGDQHPNNISDYGTPRIFHYFTNFNPIRDDGVANPHIQGIDYGQDNTGRDEDPDVGGGETLILVASYD